MYDLILSIENKANTMVSIHPELRRGQALMISLFEFDEDLYGEILGTIADCFYNDTYIPNFYQRIKLKVLEITK